MSNDTAGPPLTVDEIALAVAPAGGGDFETVVLVRRSDGALFERVGRQDWRELPRVPGTDPQTFRGWVAEQARSYTPGPRPADTEAMRVFADEPPTPRTRPAIVLPAGAGAGLPDVEPLLEKLWHLPTNAARHDALHDAGILEDDAWNRLEEGVLTDDEETEAVRLLLVSLFANGETYAAARLRNLAAVLDRIDAARRLEGRK